MLSLTRRTVQNKEHEAKEELKRRAKQLEVQRREMSRRGQTPYTSNSSAGFSQNSYTAPTPSYTTQCGASFSQAESDRLDAIPGAKPFKTKGMQLGSKGRKNESGLAEALGGLDVGEPLMSYREETREEVYTPQQEVAQQRAPSSGREANPFGEVEEAE